VKYFLPLVLLLVFVFTGCNTLNNRRSLYRTGKVHGPYTRQLEEGTWGEEKTVSEQYAEQQRVEKGPKLIPGEKKSPGSSSSVPSGTAPTPALPE
jgi:hypothetical protein